LRFGPAGPGTLDHIFQVASMAVVKGVDRHDPARGHTLSSFLVPTILGEIKRPAGLI
jgi:RNA polymerase sigma-B factor